MVVGSKILKQQLCDRKCRGKCLVEQQFHHALLHTKWVGTTQSPAHTERAPTRGHEAENLGRRSPSLPRRVILDDTFRGPGGWTGGEIEVEEEFEPMPETEGVGGPDAGRTECPPSFALSSYFSFLAGRGERG